MHSDKPEAEEEQSIPTGATRPSTHLKPFPSTAWIEESSDLQRLAAPLPLPDFAELVEHRCLSIEFSVLTRITMTSS